MYRNHGRARPLAITALKRGRSGASGDSNPPLDEAPPFSAAARQALVSLLAVMPSAESEFPYDTWRAISQLTDGYISLTGDIFTAAQDYLRTWRDARNPTTHTPAGLKLPEWIVAPELYDRATRVARYGVLPCGGRPPVRFPQTAYFNIHDNPKADADAFREDVVKARRMLFSERPEAYAGNPMESKLACVIQLGATTPDAMKVRYISDPRNDVNGRIDNDRHPHCITPVIKTPLGESSTGGGYIVRFRCSYSTAMSNG